MEQRAAMIPARPAITKQVWRPKQVVPWFERKFMADKAIIALRRKIWVMHCWSSSLANFDLCECFLACKFYQKTGGHMFAPKIGTSCLTGQTCGSHRSDRCLRRGAAASPSASVVGRTLLPTSILHRYWMASILKWKDFR
jgi:hypothetical protein